MVSPLRLPQSQQHLDERAAAERERNERLRRSFAISNPDEDWRQIAMKRWSLMATRWVIGQRQTAAPEWSTFGPKLS
jgi:hypothetical protein